MESKKKKVTDYEIEVKESSLAPKIQEGNSTVM